VKRAHVKPYASILALVGPCTRAETPGLFYFH
jgi:hypothetical protein